MTTHLPGCPLDDSAVPSTTCNPCTYIRKGIELARRMPRVDPRHEPGIGSLLAGDAGTLFRSERGWIPTGMGGPFPWPDLTAADGRVRLAGHGLRVAYSTTPLPGRTW